MIEEIMLTRKEAAKMLGACKDFIKTLVDARQITEYRAGPRYVRYKKSEMEEWIESHATSKKIIRKKDNVRT